MTHDDFGPGIPPDERDELERLASRLMAERPVPSAAFRGDLRRQIARAPRRRGAGLRLRVAAHLVSGFALLAVATLGVLDIGPLAPDVPKTDAVSAAVSPR